MRQYNSFLIEDNIQEMSMSEVKKIAKKVLDFVALEDDQVLMSNIAAAISDFRSKDIRMVDGLKKAIQNNLELEPDALKRMKDPLTRKQAMIDFSQNVGKVIPEVFKATPFIAFTTFPLNPPGTVLVVQRLMHILTGGRFDLVPKKFRAVFDEYRRYSEEQRGNRSFRECTLLA